MTNEEDKKDNVQIPEDPSKSKQPAEFEGLTDPTLDDPSLNGRVVQLEAELAQTQALLRDTQLRTQAEIDNIRRRSAQDIEKTSKFALEKFIHELLPVIDNLERALEVAQKTEPKSDAMVEGIELTLKSLFNTVNKFGVSVVDESRVSFNPEVHQAMAMVNCEDAAPNQVIMVMQKGYTLNGRLLRPAMVSVSKGKE